MLASRTPDKFERLSKRTANESVKPGARLPHAKNGALSASAEPLTAVQPNGSNGADSGLSRGE
jgi:hypothetical protein